MAVSSVLVLGSTVLACDCVTESPAESFQHADVVFEGVMIRNVESSPGNTSYTFRVRQSFKGSPASELTLVQESSDCDATFWPDTVYRVFARSSEGKLSSGICFGNEVLGYIQQTKDSKSMTSSQIVQLLPFAAAVGLVATIIWLLGRRRA